MQKHNAAGKLDLVAPKVGVVIPDRIHGTDRKVVV